MDKEYMKELAAQLRNPFGEKGLEIAQMMHETNIGMTLHAIGLLNLKTNDKILEIGHGNAGHLKSLLSKTDNIRYTGYDISELMHDFAKEINQEFINKGIAEFKLYNGIVFPVDDNQFDKIFTVNTIYFWENSAEMLVEVHRILKTDGMFCITFGEKEFMEILPFTAYGFTLYSTDDMEELVKKSPFELKDISRSSEMVKNKLGEKIIRRFATALLTKTH